MSKTYLKVKQSENNYLSPWKISNILDSLASECYRKVLLDQLTEKLADMSKDNIPIIFKSSFDLYQKYSKLKDYSVGNREDIENLYYLGNFAAITPNIKLKKIEIIFKLHRDIFKMINRVDILMDRSKILDYTIPNFNEEDEINFDSLIIYVNELLGEEHDSLKNDIHKKIGQVEKSFKNFTLDLAEINIINKMDEKEFLEYIKDFKNQTFVNKYYNDFFNTFINHARPVIGIFNTVDGTIEILTKEFIKETLHEQNDEKIEVKEISKNSPTFMAIVIGYIATTYLANTFFVALGKKKAKIEQTIESVEEGSKEQLNQEILKLREAMQSLEAQIVQDKFTEKIVNINDFRIIRGLKRVQKDVDRKIVETFDKNEFLNSNIELIPIASSEIEGEEEN